MFDRAAEIIERGDADRAVCLMDIPDDWLQGFNIDLYIETYDRAMDFHRRFPDTLWCYGNHDLSYVWHLQETGFSLFALETVNLKLKELEDVIADKKQLAYIHRIDNVLFLHGGLNDSFVRHHAADIDYDDVDAVIEKINGLGARQMWDDASPIWYRPQVEDEQMYMQECMLQVVGHTPVERITREGNVISCDVFSTYRGGRPIGTREFPVIDTVTWECTGIRENVPDRNDRLGAERV
jgi:hypothetical protein